jgi:hypothetical protein
MTSGGQSVEQLRDYLRHLKPEARAMLIQELERGLLRGDDSPANQFILDELRRAIRAEAQPAPRVGDAARLFFTPFEPFLFDGRADHKRAGRIARVSLEPIWQWIGRDLIPAEAKALGEDINRALLADDKAKAEQLARALQDRAMLRMRETLAAAGSDERLQRRLAIQVGTPRAVEDVTTMLVALEFRDMLTAFARWLPNHIRVFDREIAEATRTQLDAQLAKCAAGTRKADAILYGLVIAINRLTSPWQLIRIAVRAADSDATERIAATPYGAAVTLALAEIENTVAELRSEFKAGRPVASILKELHDAARGLRSEMDLSVDSAWSRQLAAIRAEISNLLRSEIDAAPGRVRRLLRPRPAKEITSGSTVDAADVDEVDARVALVTVCRNYAGELALSEMTTRAYAELTQYLETGTEVLLDSLRHAGDADRPFRQSQVDAAIRICRTMFGRDYAGTLTKAADVAIQAAINEKKQAARG